MRNLTLLLSFALITLMVLNGCGNSASPEIALTDESVFDFHGLKSGEMIYMGEYQITPEKTTLEIESYSVYPMGPIAIGFYNLKTGQEFGIQYTQGYFDSKSINATEMPSGKYAVYVRNNNNLDVSSGILRFSVTE